MALKAVRRVVTGVDERGHSKVRWDGPSPGEHESNVPSKGHIDFWTWRESPLPLDGEEDPATWDDEFPGPQGGGHLRLVSWFAQAADPSEIPAPEPFHAPEPRPGGRTWTRGGGNNFDRTAMHKTQSVDLGIMLEGERSLLLDNAELLLGPGDIVVQVGAWHLWDSSRIGCLMAFDMIPAEFVDGPVGLAQGNDPVIHPPPNQQLPDGVKPQRRVVTIDREPGKSSLVADSPSPDVRLDPARPGFALQRVWVVDGTPARIVSETLHLPHILEPPDQGAVLSVVTFPPDSAWRETVGASDVAAWFESIGSASASTYSAEGPHPYMQKTRTVDFCFVIEGELVLVLDTEEVAVKAGEVVIQRGTNHAWSNRSNAPAVVAIASHDAR
jgi:mannose-6-phosphate isomerase-like protein (cupin superfamily)